MTDQLVKSFTTELLKLSLNTWGDCKDESITMRRLSWRDSKVELIKTRKWLPKDSVGERVPAEEVCVMGQEN